MQTATSPGGRHAGGTPVLAGGASLLGDQDLHLFNEGTHQRLYEKLGSHLVIVDGEPGTYFAVWAPNAERVAVMADFNDWDPGSHPLQRPGRLGRLGGLRAGRRRRRLVQVPLGLGRQLITAVDKADPFAVRHETPPRTGSVVWDLSYEWGDEAWMRQRKAATPCPLRRHL
jgi:1,4-alpha-glucan branching enzyme